MERNKNIDIVRAISIIIIVVYHIFAISHVSLIHGKLNSFVEYSGEYGVVVFFMISGFSIYKSLYNRKDNFQYDTYLKNRLKRILPQYYISLIILLFFTESNFILFSREHIYNIFSHIFLFHGFYPSIQGSISGVAWTLTPIFFFYLIAPFIFKVIEKKPKLTLFLSIIFSCLFKVVVYTLFSKSVNEIGFNYYFTFGRSIFGAIDEFVLGMFLAKYIKVPKDNKKIILNILLLLLSLILLYFWIIVDKNKINIIFNNTNRLTNCFEAYIWYSVLSIILAIGIYGFSKIKINYENPISKLLLFISKHEYGIYLWHLEFIKITCISNIYIQSLITSNRRIIYVFLGLCSIFIGILMSIIIDGIIWKNVSNEFKNLNKILIYSICILTIFVLFKNNIMLIPNTFDNIRKIKETSVDFETNSQIIAVNAIIKIPEDKKYAYIDTSETVYQYFWEIRYFLAPRETEHINLYVDVLLYGTNDEIFKKLKEMDTDYFIVNNCKFIEGQDIVYKKNVNANSIEELFEKLD